MRCLIKPLGIIHNGLPGNCLNLMINLVTTSGNYDVTWSTAQVVKDSGYMILVGMWVGVPMGMGMGPYLVTHQKPLPMIPMTQMIYLWVWDVVG